MYLVFLDLEHSLDLEHQIPATKFGFMLYFYLDLVHSLDLEHLYVATDKVR